VTPNLAFTRTPNGRPRIGIMLIFTIARPAVRRRLTLLQGLPHLSSGKYPEWTRVSGSPCVVQAEFGLPRVAGDTLTSGKTVRTG
jgi:hypothetical protein